MTPTIRLVGGDCPALSIMQAGKPSPEQYSDPQFSGLLLLLCSKAWLLLNGSYLRELLGRIGGSGSGLPARDLLSCFKHNFSFSGT